MKKLLLSLLMFASLAANAVTEIKFEQLQKEIDSSIESVIVVDFYADWCGPCQKYKPMLEKAEKKFAGRVKFFRIDTEKDAELKGKIRALPTTVVFKKKNGEVSMGMVEGLPPSQKVLEDSLETLLKK